MMWVIFGLIALAGASWAASVHYHPSNPRNQRKDQK
jgi:hypothetical protein